MPVTNAAGSAASATASAASDNAAAAPINDTKLPQFEYFLSEGSRILLGREKFIKLLEEYADSLGDKTKMLALKDKLRQLYAQFKKTLTDKSSSKEDVLQCNQNYRGILVLYWYLFDALNIPGNRSVANMPQLDWHDFRCDLNKEMLVFFILRNDLTRATSLIKNIYQQQKSSDFLIEIIRDLIRFKRLSPIAPKFTPEIFAVLMLAVPFDTKTKQYDNQGLLAGIIYQAFRRCEITGFLEHFFSGKNYDLDKFSGMKIIAIQQIKKILSEFKPGDNLKRLNYLQWVKRELPQLFTDELQAELAKVSKACAEDKSRKAVSDLHFQTANNELLARNRDAAFAHYTAILDAKDAPSLEDKFNAHRLRAFCSDNSKTVLEDCTAAITVFKKIHSVTRIEDSRIYGHVKDEYRRSTRTGITRYEPDLVRLLSIICILAELFIHRANHFLRIRDYRQALENYTCALNILGISKICFSLDELRNYYFDQHPSSSIRERVCYVKSGQYIVSERFDRDLFFNMAECYNALGDPETAIRFYIRAMQTAGTNAATIALCKEKLTALAANAENSAHFVVAFTEPEPVNPHSSTSFYPTSAAGIEDAQDFCLRYLPPESRMTANQNSKPGAAQFYIILLTILDRRKDLMVYYVLKICELLSRTTNDINDTAAVKVIPLSKLLGHENKQKSPTPEVTENSEYQAYEAKVLEIEGRPKWDPELATAIEANTGISSKPVLSIITAYTRHSFFNVVMRNRHDYIVDQRIQVADTWNERLSKTLSSPNRETDLITVCDQVITHPAAFFCNKIAAYKARINYYRTHCDPIPSNLIILDYDSAIELALKFQHSDHELFYEGGLCVFSYRQLSARCTILQASDG